jgi:hypothetical protein
MTLRRGFRQRFSRLGCLFWPSATSRFVGEPLATHSKQRQIGAFHVINPELHSVRVAEIKLAQIPLQMSF